ncbi:hypothetical protein ATANTOWER_031584 [Ataeniobius toweri]|uniref:Uncharacterized protein n=1 Tax=Ataeniobius toweri TaxID=208326 RepID=A0ABU7A9F0_9TELE|nr:hypothetical protein [Ataeniobius toweri]
MRVYNFSSTTYPSVIIIDRGDLWTLTRNSISVDIFILTLEWWTCFIQGLPHMVRIQHRSQLCVCSWSGVHTLLRIAREACKHQLQSDCVQKESILME